MSLVVPVACGLVVKEGKVLLIRRRGKTFSGLLSIPGGKIGFGEQVEDSAVREVEEETGIQSRFVRHLATIPEHIIEDGRLAGHFVLQLCELEFVEELDEREYDPVWVGIDELDSFKEEMTPSDYLMIREILLSGGPASHHSLTEKRGDTYRQLEFRRI